MSKKPHLTDTDRQQIEFMLKRRHSLKRIAEEIGKSRSTIAREIKKRSVESNKFAPHYPQNRCIKRKHCKHCKHELLCEDKPDYTKRCSLCKRCNEICPMFDEEVCPHLSEPPYVCNGCFDEHRCVLKKRYYLHKQAHGAYRELLIESRQGVNITEEELLELDEFLSPLIKQGQSVSHIFTNNPDRLNISESSAYRYVAGGLLEADNLDMPRVVRFKPRKTKPREHKIDTGCRIGRSILDYRKFMEKSDFKAIEMDTVKGGVSGKVLLTMMFESCGFMPAFLRDRNTAQTVIDHFNRLYTVLGADIFNALFPVILTDNGSEFSNPKALEFDLEGKRRTNIFYCNPNASWQKPHVELNHEFIRKIIPKGISMDSLTQKDIDLMMSHINSYSRGKLGNKSPFEMFNFLYGEGLAEKLGQTKILPHDIILV